MKENVFDVLMYLFENYLYEENRDYAPNEEALREELLDMGFPHGEVRKAFQWLEDLGECRSSPVEIIPSNSVRVFTDREAKRIDTESQGFLHYLEQNGVLDMTARELVIDRVMALEDEEISLEKLKWVILMVMVHQPGYEEAFAWLHDLVYENLTDRPH